MYQLGYLSERLEFIPTIAQWHFQEWGHHGVGDSVERRVEWLTEAANRQQVPTVIIAYEGDKVLGTAMLVESDMKIRRELTPWVASVYVAAEECGKGIGAALVLRVTEEAKALGYARIYLFAFDAEKYYARMGWQLRERVEYLGVEVAVMERDL